MIDARLRLPILCSVLAAVMTIALKWLAYALTGSVGLLSDAAESVVNLVAAVTAFVSLWYASRPVDPSHTYGHEKIEYFSSGLEGILILVAAAGIAWYAVRRLLAPHELESLDLGTLVALAAAFINLLVALWLLRAGRKHRSIVLEADGRHLMTDVVTSFAVVAGLGLVSLTGWMWLDPVLALIVAGNIVWSGVQLIWKSFDGLMDHSLSQTEQAAVRQAIEGNLGPGTTYHALRTRQAGSRRFADFHLLVPGRLSVHAAHNLCVRIEDAIRAALAGIEVTVHIEPIEDRQSWGDSELLAVEAQAQKARTSP